MLPAASEGGLADRDTQPLQQLLLEGVANDSVRDSADVGRLVCSTFAAHQQVRGGAERMGRYAGQTVGYISVGSVSIPEIACLAGGRLPAPGLQGVDAMRHASRAALRVLIRDKKLVQYTAGQARICVTPASKQAPAMAG